MSFAYRATRSTRRGLAGPHPTPGAGVAAAGVVALSLAGFVAGLPGAQAVGADLGASSVAPMRPSAALDRPVDQRDHVEWRVEGEDARGHFSVTSTTVDGVQVLGAACRSLGSPGTKTTGSPVSPAPAAPTAAVTVSRRAFAAGSATSVYLAAAATASATRSREAR